MSITLGVDIEQCIYDAAKDLTGSAFIKPALLRNEFEEIASTTIFEEQINEQIILVGLAGVSKE